MDGKRTIGERLALVALVVALAACVLAVWAMTLPKPTALPATGAAPPVTPEGGVESLYDYNCSVYMEQGCGKQVVASGGELEVQSGGTLDLQSGSSVNAEDLTASGTITGVDLVATDDVTAGDDITATGSLVGADAAIGGGYGSTGCTLSGAGVLQCDGATTTDSDLTVGGNGAITGTLTVTGSSTFAGITVGGTGITIDSMVFTYTDAITISGVLTNVRLLYYQVP